MSFTNLSPSASWKSDALVGIGTGGSHGVGVALITTGATDGLVDTGAEFIGEVQNPVNKIPATVPDPDAGVWSATEVPAPWVGGVEATSAC
jgi:hypothetical protein